MTTNLRPGPEISSLYAFGSAIYLFDKTRQFVPKPGTKHFVPVSCKRLQKFHTGLSSSRSHVNTPLVFQRNWSLDESEKSSTWRELAAIKFPIEAFGTCLSKQRVRWHTDSRNAFSVGKFII